MSDVKPTPKEVLERAIRSIPDAAERYRATEALAKLVELADDRDRVGRIAVELSKRWFDTAQDYFDVQFEELGADLDGPVADAYDEFEQAHDEYWEKLDLDETGEWKG